MAFWNGTQWAQDEPTSISRPRGERGRLGAAGRAGLITMLILGLTAGTVSAAPGGGGGKGGSKNSGGSGSLTLVMVDDANGNGLPNRADSVTFEVSTTATDKPLVSVACLQAGTSVYRASTGYYEGYPWPWTQIMTLTSEAWTGGAADCTAELYFYDGKRFKTLATLSFHAGA
jgi:hypothetical protein